MANDFYFNPIERVAGIADSCGMQIMSSTRRPYDIASPLTCLKPAPICAPSRFCLAMPSSRDTTVYLHLSRRHLQAVPSPAGSHRGVQP